MKCIVRQKFTEDILECDVTNIFIESMNNFEWIDTIDDTLNVVVKNLENVYLVENRYLFV